MTAAVKRRWFRISFSLKTLFVAVTVVAVWLGWNLSIVRERKAVIAEIELWNGERGSSVSLESMESGVWVGFYNLRERQFYEYCRVPRIRRLLGDESIIRVALFNEQLVDRTERAFPEAELYFTTDNDTQFRDSLYKPATERFPNHGTIFKTGLIEKSSDIKGSK